jgi:TIR domain
VRDIFISYASEDRLAAERLAEALTREGWSVWWDPDIPPGDVWDELIEQELAAVCCVVVLWSASSVQKQWVKAEAAEAAARGILVPALIEDVRPPLAFRQIEAARLCDWRGEVDHREFQQLLGTISRLVRCACTGRGRAGAAGTGGVLSPRTRASPPCRPRSCRGSGSSAAAPTPEPSRRRGLGIQDTNPAVATVGAFPAMAHACEDRRPRPPRRRMRLFRPRSIRSVGGVAARGDTGNRPSGQPVGRLPARPHPLTKAT